MKKQLKKFTAFILSLLLACSIGLQAFAACSGDLTGDNKIDTEDARAILRAALDLDPLTAANKTAADMDLDGKVTTEDARLALRIALELEKTNGKLYKNQYDVLRSGFFCTDFTIKESNGEQPLLLAVTGKTTFMRTSFADETLSKEFGIDGFEISMLQKKGKAYLVDQNNRAYAPFPLEETGMAPEEIAALEDAKNMFAQYPALDKAVKKEKTTFGGRSCTGYTFNYNKGTLQVFMRGKILLGITEYTAKGAEKKTYSFRSVSLAVPTEYTAIPAGYEKTDPMVILMAAFFGDLTEPA